jgi:hypothetical protein
MECMYLQSALVRHAVRYCGGFCYRSLSAPPRVVANRIPIPCTHNPSVCSAAPSRLSTSLQHTCRACMREVLQMLWLLLWWELSLRSNSPCQPPPSLSSSTLSCPLSSFLLLADCQHPCSRPAVRQLQQPGGGPAALQRGVGCGTALRGGRHTRQSERGGLCHRCGRPVGRGQGCMDHQCEPGRLRHRCGRRSGHAGEGTLADVQGSAE